MNTNTIRQKPQSYVLIAIVLIVVLIGVKRMIDARSNNTITPSITSTTDEQIKETPIKKNYVFSMKDSAGKDIGKINYSVESGYKSKEIVSKGKRFQATEDKTFLVLNLKLKNDLSQSLKVNSADYIRLSINGNTNEWFAPDIQNDPIDLQPISTKAVRLAFTVNSSDKDLMLQVGEVNGAKEAIKLKVN